MAQASAAVLKVFVVMYKLVMFKVLTDKSKGASVPAVPETAFNMCYCAWTDCTTEYSFCFVIIDDAVSESELATELKVIPLTTEEEEKFKENIETARNEVDYLNGVKQRPVFIMGEK